MHGRGRQQNGLNGYVTAGTFSLEEVPAAIAEPEPLAGPPVSSRLECRMFVDRPDSMSLHQPLAGLERTLITEYLEARGCDPTALRQRTDPAALALLRDASSHASARLAEIETRAHYVHEMHHLGSAPSGAPHTRHRS